MGLRTSRVRTIVILSALSALVLCSGAAILRAIVNDLTLVETLHPANTEHLDQGDLLALVQANRKSKAFTDAFEHGDELFETEFNAAAGVGANVGDGGRFTRVPRADLTAAGQWATHTPKRATGPNAVSCAACHEQPFDDGSGAAVSNVHRDPLHSGSLKQFIQRNTPHVFALGALQRLAEEMTGELQMSREAAGRQACSFGMATSPLVAKGVSFGAIKATRVRSGSGPCGVTFDTSLVSGVSADLIVRPFQWKGTVKTVREFNRDAAHNELGMQAVEFTGDNVDGDGDGVVNELSVGDITALTIYLAAQPRPTTKLELARLNLIDPLSPAEDASINAGAKVFGRIGCASCHVPQLLLDDPVFSEPSGNPQYRDGLFPAGQNARDRGVHPRFPVSFDLTRDQPDNRITDGGLIVPLGSFERDIRGRAVIQLFSDLKRHNMGRKLAEAIDEEGTGAASFLTRTLWGAGSSGPYLHDGRATTITEAILEHGGEAAESRNKFIKGSLDEQKALIAFIDNLVLFKMEE